MSLFATFSERLNAILDTVPELGGASRSGVAVEPPRDPAHGDLAINAAMVLAKPAGMNPRALAETLVAKLRDLPEVVSAEIAGPGFINLRLSDDSWRDELRAIHAEAADYGRSRAGAGKRVNVEYV